MKQRKTLLKERWILIKKAMIDKGIVSFEELGRRIGKSGCYIGLIINDKRKALRVRVEIARVLGLEVEEILPIKKKK